MVRKEGDNKYEAGKLLRRSGYFGDSKSSFLLLNIVNGLVRRMPAPNERQQRHML